MSDLDDALNTTSPVFLPPTVTADWEELPTGVSVGGVDSIRDLGQQIGPQGFGVNHSYDDGLPDAVTMTSTEDASGSMGMDLIGRQANVADVVTGWRAGTSSGSGSGTSIPVTIPAGALEQDYVIVAITADNASGVYEAGLGDGNPWGWTLLATSADGTLNTYVFGRSHWTASPAPDFRIRTTGSWSWAAGNLGANYTANASSIVPNKPGVATAAAESVTGTAHTGPYASLPARGHLLGVFSAPNASGPWTVASGGTQLVQSTGGVAALQLVKSDLKTLEGDYRFSSSTAGSTGVAMMINVPLAVADRPAMDAMAYFSPFEERSPIRDFERDTAAVSASVNVLSPNGPVSTQIFKGQMAGIPTTGRSAQLQAVSRTRIQLDKALLLPTVYGNREGCTTDWLASYLLANGGQYPGIAPSPNTRFWAPMHGSLHPFMSGANSYAAGIYFDAARTPKGPYAIRPPQSVDGPFVGGMYGKIADDQTDVIYSSCYSQAWDTEVPGMTAERHDLVSDQNSVGRLTFWIRGDANMVAPASLSGTSEVDYLMQASVYSYYDATVAADFNLIRIRINSARQPVVWLESGLTLTGGDIPLDGEWHFVGFVWDYHNGLAKVRRDNLTWDLSGFTSNGYPKAPSEQSIYDGGRYVGFSIASRVPIAEVQLEAGPTLYSEQFTRFYPTPAAPSLNATFRQSRQNLQAIAKSTPVQGWETLQNVAEATLSSIRVNEDDNAEFVPLSFFGETANMTVEAYNVLDTDVNASELDVVIDPSKIRNYVTADYSETRVDSTRAPVLDISSAIAIPAGKTEITFPLEIPAAEIHGAASPNTGTTWDLTILTAAQVAGSSALPNEHFMSLNKYSDGSAVTYTGSGITARIISWTSSTIGVRFNNSTGATYYLANNGQSIPFLRLLGYPIREVDAYAAFRDSSSAAKRRERSLAVPKLDWVQEAQVASEFVGQLTNVISGPRPQLSLTVAGDPRRRPFQLVTIKDAHGTAADGTWRILSLSHSGGGAKYTQDLTIVRVGPVGYWDEGLWDDAVWGE